MKGSYSTEWQGYLKKRIQTLMARGRFANSWRKAAVWWGGTHLGAGMFEEHVHVPLD